MSFEPIGITASLVNGIPKRDTCTQAPVSEGLAPVVLSVRVAGRLADAHTPITKLASNILVAELTDKPVFCNELIGIFNAIECTFLCPTPSTAPAPARV